MVNHSSRTSFILGLAVSLLLVPSADCFVPWWGVRTKVNINHNKNINVFRLKASLSDPHPPDSPPPDDVVYFASMDEDEEENEQVDEYEYQYEETSSEDPHPTDTLLEEDDDEKEEMDDSLFSAEEELDEVDDKVDDGVYDEEFDETAAKEERTTLYANEELLKFGSLALEQVIVSFFVRIFFILSRARSLLPSIVSGLSFQPIEYPYISPLPYKICLFPTPALAHAIGNQKPMADIQKGVPAERIKGAALAGAFLGVLASKGIVFSSAAGLSAAYLAISKGIAGDVLRTVGGITWDVTDTVARLVNIIAANDRLNVLPKALTEKAMNALQDAQLKARNLDNKWGTSGAYAAEVEAAEQAFLDSQDDLAKVLEEAEAVLGEADVAIANAQGATEGVQQVVDVSVPYDAAAELAYEESDKSVAFDAFRVKYLAEAVKLVTSKHVARLEKQNEARVEAMRLAEEKRAAEEAEQQRLEEEARIAEEERAAEEAEQQRLEEEARIAEEERAAAEAEKERLAAEEQLEEEEEEDEDTDEEADEDYMDDDDFLAAVELAQDGLEGKIVGVDEVIADTNAKAEWDAAGTLARELQQDEDDEDEEDILLDDDDFEGLDLEALGKAAREAVELFEDGFEMAEEAKLQQRKEWGDSAPPSFDFEVTNGMAKDWSKAKVAELRDELKKRGMKTEGKKKELIARLQEDYPETTEVSSDYEDVDDFEEEADEMMQDVGEDDEEDFDFGDVDVEELGRQARAAVQMFRSGTEEFGEEPTEEMLAELENEMAINGEFLGEPKADFSKMTVVQLKEECRSRGLKVSGKKAELVARLESATN